ncbi:YggS family pyridoxal phosphate-dependent enzyme [Enterobacter sp. 638]|uniref:Pyridoxal phosphate homeostasis protein n=1 Tax=Enterobacter sp. (strain 638) TaxID=399742 RepID=A0A9J9KYM2_ENT38|nr:YggS family pyridoxal phosphate-dependent enzyme [Enterobacter sp. 638]ABP62817.1 alanine racemase domain protein [Enterobacter sp. 638]
MKNTENSTKLLTLRDTQPRCEMHNRWPRAESVQDFIDNLAAVQSRIDAACQRSGRNVSDVRLLPVSKTMDEKHIRMAHQAGCNFLGENKVQEAWRKSQAMLDLTDLKWSVIGHLQSNKAKLVARFASEFQALDSFNTAEILDRRLQVEGRTLNVFVQVNTSAEPSKFGLAPETVVDFMAQLSTLKNIKLIGLMTLAEFTSDAERVRSCFIRLRKLRDQLANVYGNLQLSMGMSGDFEIAIEEGANIVRVGQAIFGARSLPDEYFWPKGE